MKKLGLLLVTLLLSLSAFTQNVHNVLDIQVVESVTIINGKEYNGTGGVDIYVTFFLNDNEVYLHYDDEFSLLKYGEVKKYTQGGFEITSGKSVDSETQFVIQKKVGENWYGVSFFKNGYKVIYIGHEIQ